MFRRVLSVMLQTLVKLANRAILSAAMLVRPPAQQTAAFATDRLHAKLAFPDIH